MKENTGTVLLVIFMAVLCFIAGCLIGSMVTNSLWVRDCTYLGKRLADQQVYLCAKEYK